MDHVDGVSGPWVLIGGFISESTPRDVRKMFTFINSVLTDSSYVSKLRSRFNRKEYSGSREIPGPWEDYYTFAGEVPWSHKFGGEFYEEEPSKRHMAECFSLHKTYTVRIKSSDLSNSDMLSLDISHTPLIKKDTQAGEESLELAKKPKTLPKYVYIHQYKTIPGVEVEVPIHSLSWESYHSTENQGGYADFVAPALCDYLKLKNKGDSQDLYDSGGLQASIYRIFVADDSDFFKSHLLYIRKDLLKNYLKHTKQKLVWFIWGEREFKHEAMEAEKSKIQDIWYSNAHVHKRMKVARI